MGVYIYAIKSTPVKTNLGFSFNPSKYSHKPSLFGSTGGFFSPIPVSDWEKTLAKKERMRAAREERTERIFMDRPDRWTNLIGESVDGYDSKDESKMLNGIVVKLYKKEIPTATWADINEPGEYVGTIKKVGRGEWTWVDKLVGV